MLVLGQCFQHIKQYPLAMNHYESAIQEIPTVTPTIETGPVSGGLVGDGVERLRGCRKALTTLASLDFTYKDVSGPGDKIAKLRDNPGSGDGKRP